MSEDIRWEQRYNNFIKAYNELKDGVELSQTKNLSKLEKQGLIQGFEYTHELAWNVLKDFLTDQGITGLIGSKDSTREAFKSGLITNGEVWMDMIKARNLTSHTYDEELAENIFIDITENFYPVLKDFKDKFIKILEDKNV
jgi:nucleotidyltransferase substrate binding protein (TIGR01987 family)